MIRIEVKSPFWEDPATVTFEGEDREGVLHVCATALTELDYAVHVYQGEDELVPWEDYLEDNDAEAA